QPSIEINRKASEFTGGDGGNVAKGIPVVIMDWRRHKTTVNRALRSAAADRAERTNRTAPSPHAAIILESQTMIIAGGYRNRVLKNLDGRSGGQRASVPDCWARTTRPDSAIRS